MIKKSDWLPPILARALRQLVPPPAPAKSSEVCGRLLAHRGSHADFEVVKQIFSQRDYDLSRLKRNDEIAAYYEATKRPLIIDAGANIGASAVWFSTVFPRAKVIAVEPHPDNFRLLSQNVAGLDVDCVPGALAPTSGRLSLLDPGEGEWGFRTGPAASQAICEVAAFTIADLVGHVHSPFILKIDIEGGEDGLFDRLGEEFARFPVIIIELHDWMLPRGNTSKSFLRWHASQDRDFVHLGENVFSICNHLLPNRTRRAG